MKKLGQVLVERGWLTHERLLKAVDSQRERGGQLGTCLLELGLVSEDLVVKGLALQLGVPFASFDMLRGIPEDVYELLPGKLAVRAKAVPFAVQGSTISMAMLEVADLLLQDELSFVTGRRVVPHVANESRLYEALEKYYGAEMPPRFVSLCDRLSRSRFLWDKDESVPVAPVPEPLRLAPLLNPTARSAFDSGIAMTLPPPLPHLATPPGGISGLGTKSTTATTGPQEVTFSDVQEPPAAAVQIASPATPPPPLPTQQEAAHFAKGLRVLGDRDQIGQQLVQFLLRLFSRTVVFMVRKKRVDGWVGAGDGVAQSRLESFSCALNQPSLFLSLQQGSSSYVGPLPPLPTHRSLAQIWGGRLPTACVLLPIRLKGRLVAIVYADGLRQGRAPDMVLLQQLTNAASAAFEFCIVQQKLESA